MNAFDVGDRHVAGVVGVAGKREVQHRGQRLGAAAGVAGPGGDELLHARVTAGGVDHRAPLGVVLESAGHLLGIDHGIEVVHLLVGHAVAPFARRVFDDLAGAVELEGRQRPDRRISSGARTRAPRPPAEPAWRVPSRSLWRRPACSDARRTKPSCTLTVALRRGLRARGGGGFRCGQLQLLVDAQIVIAAQPEAELEPFTLQRTEEGVRPLGRPVGNGETLRGARPWPC